MSSGFNLKFWKLALVGLVYHPYQHYQRMALAPRFPQELFDLIIDEYASEGLEQWPYVPREDICGGCCYSEDHGVSGSCQSDEDSEQARTTLTALSLVSKRWYSRASKHLWWGVTLSDPEALRRLHSILTAKPELMKLVKHVALHSILETMEWEEEFVLEHLARLLGPTASFMHFCHDDGLERIIDERSWDQNRLLIRAITSFCHSGRLTSLFYAGNYFPTQILADVPNLRDFALHRAESSGPMIDGCTTFRLKRAHFCELDSSIYRTLLYGVPKAFSQLEELTFEGMEDEWVDENSTSQILLLAKDTVRKVHIGGCRPAECMGCFFLQVTALLSDQLSRQISETFTKMVGWNSDL